MKKDFEYYFGYILAIVVGIICTPIYAVCITIMRSIITLCHIIWDSITLLPRTLYEFDKSYEKKYWEKELERINKKYKDD